MNRLEQERDYWNAAAQDPEVDIKYICDIPTDACLTELGELKGNVLEIGCGVGRLMKTGYYGVDISPEMLEIAKQRKPDCHFQVIEGSLLFDDEMFNTVYSMLVFQHLKPDSVFAYIKEAHRVLKPGGVFRFQYIEGTEREPFSNHYLQEEVENWLMAAGFKTIEWQDSKLHNSWRWATATK